MLMLIDECVCEAGVQIEYNMSYCSETSETKLDQENSKEDTYFDE